MSTCDIQTGKKTGGTLTGAMPNTALVRAYGVKPVLGTMTGEACADDFSIYGRLMLEEGNGGGYLLLENGNYISLEVGNG